MLVCPRDCYDTCFLEAESKGDKFLKLRALNHVLTQGILCPRASMDLKRTFSRKRVLYPFKALSKCSNNFKRISWEEAINVIVQKLKSVLETHGESTVLVLDYAGNRGIFSRYLPQRLWYFLKAARTNYSLCDYSGYTALKLHYGSSYGLLPESISNLKLIVYWGFNAAVTNLHGFLLAEKIRRKSGLKIVAISSLKDETAEKADIWLRPKYGSDAFLALGVANYVIEHKLYDKEFIEKYTYGFDRFREYVKKFTVNYVAKITNIPENKIINFAELYARLKPNAIYIGYGLQRREGGGETVRAISLLPALVGQHRGFYYSNTDGLQIDFDYLLGINLGKPSRIIPQSKVGEFVSKGEFKFIFIFLTNPVATYPNAGLIKKGLCRDDVFVVVHETHWTDTALCADVVLPAPTYLEKDDVVFSYWHNYCALSKKIIKPLGESKTELEVMRLIAQKLGIKHSFLYEDPYQALRKALGSEVFQELIRGKIVKIPYKKLEEYQTLTKKIEFYSLTAMSKNFPPLPSPNIIPVDKEYPLILVSSANIKYTHTQFEDVYGPLPPLLYVSSEDAKKYDLRENEVVKVCSKYGCVKLKIKVSERVPQGVVFTYRSCTTVDHKRINEITSPEEDSLGGATLNTTYVKVIKSDS